MLDVMIGIPPRIFHGTAMTSYDVVTFWVTLSVIVALVLLITIALVIAENRSLQGQSQMKAAERHYEAFPQPQGGEQPPVHAPEEEKVLLRR
jgi:hypothetical protein